VVALDLDELDLGEEAASGRVSPQIVINTQKKKHVRRAKSLCAVADVVAIVAALSLAASLVGDGDIASPEGGVLQSQSAVAMLSLPCWLFAFSNLRLYMSRFTADRMEEFRRIVHACLFGVMSLAVVGLAVNTPVAREWPALAFCFAVVFVVGIREIVRRVFVRLRRTGHLRRRVLVVGANAEGSQLCSWLLRDTSLGYEVLGFVDDAVPVGETVGQWSVLGGTRDTVATIRKTGATGVLIATTALDTTISNRLARDLLSAGIHVELSSSLCDIAADRLSVRSLGRFPMLCVEPVARNGWRPLAKRAFDVSIAAATLLVTLPLFIAAAIAIKLDSPGPVFFKQERIGENGKRFRCVKFRTMVVEAEQRRAELEALNEAGSGFFKIAHDPRVTRVGRFLRKWSIDEFPQLLNVISGDMSLVGPRPLPARDVIAHWGSFMERRLLARPGITGLWQVSGRSSANPADYERLDLYYVDNWSLITDVTILLRTIPAVLFRRGAS
jgi:exopolysaccharide biosynthesis polyprenyl glycosylphosphotransferase